MSSVLKTDVGREFYRGFESHLFLHPLLWKQRMSYSIDVLKKSAFHHELMSVLALEPQENRDEAWMIIQDYFKARIKELDEATKR